ncbi:polyphosphate polymerase domain-containing protein [Paramicrobacterium sp. CJ85]|uniref:polyphosphate polymerase domain-containing protein n=1 Tax=Paramicrobacterium sp. CJ85 TaxID=3445355 RepID=UPI003F62F537
MTRVDRKYFVPRDLLAAIMTRELTEFRMLQIDGGRVFDYRTVYFDSPDFVFFRQHAQGRRHRYKVRTRTYESGDCMLEVKSKGYRGQTVKERIDHDPVRPERLGERDHRFIDSIVDTDPHALTPVLHTDYRRGTLCHGSQRVTLDLDLRFYNDRASFDGPDSVLVETKTEGSAGPLDRALLGEGIRAHSVSKYCIAATLLYPHLPGNAWYRTIRRQFPDALALAA